MSYAVHYIVLYNMLCIYQTKFSLLTKMYGRYLKAQLMYVETVALRAYSVTRMVL